MTYEETKALKIGDMVYNGSIKGTVCETTGATVTLVWTHIHGFDTVQRSSPLLRYLHTEPKK